VKIMGTKVIIPNSHIIKDTDTQEYDCMEPFDPSIVPSILRRKK
jgi:hypothetical protein